MTSVEPSSGRDRNTTPAASAGGDRVILVGRETELRTLVRMLEPGGASVVNVTGARGAGKSALVQAAIETVGAGLTNVQRLDFGGETATSALATLRGLVSSMPIPIRRGGSLTTPERTLVCLDRADVLAQVGADLVRLVVKEGSALVLVIESVPQVRAPDIGVVSVGALEDVAAEQLFRSTAESVAVSFGTDEETTSYVRRICAAVDRNPLAIELAAVRLPLLPLPSLAAVVESPRALSVLTRPASAAGPARDVRADLADSQVASSTDAQALLDLLSVFTGSFTIEAIEAVGGQPPDYDALGELLDLRLVEVDTGEPESRYRLSRLVRGFAAQRLVASGRESDLRAGWATYYGGLARRAALAYDDADEEGARGILGEDYPEALAALRWLVSVSPADALRLAADLGWEASRRGAGAGLVEVLEHLARADLPGTEAARRDALLWLAQLASWSPRVGDQSEHIRRELAEALELGRRLGDPVPLLRALRTQFVAAAGLGDIATAMASCEEGIRRASELGHARWLGRFEIALAATHGLRHEYAEAVRLATSGLGRAIRADDRQGIALGSLALHAMPAEYVANRAELPPLDSVLDRFRAQGDLTNELNALAVLAQEAVERGDTRAAATWVLTRQERVGKAELLIGLTISTMLTVHIGRLHGDHAMAARLHGSVASHTEPLMALLAPRHSAMYREGLESLRKSLGDREFDAQVAQGRALDRNQTLIEVTGYLRTVCEEPVAVHAPVGSADQGRELTPKERQVLTLLARGMRNKEIAGELRITSKTVMHHTVSIYRKLGVRGRTEAVMTATRSGQLPST